MPSNIPLSKAHKSTITVMSKIPIFNGMPLEEYHDFLEICDIWRFSEGEVVFEQDSPSTGMFALLSGDVSISTKEKGTIHQMKTGELLGEIGLLCQVKRTATATCNSDSVFLQIKKQDLNFLLGKSPNVYSKLIKNIAIFLAEKVITLTDTKTIEATTYTKDSIPSDIF